MLTYKVNPKLYGWWRIRCGKVSNYIVLPSSTSIDFFMSSALPPNKRVYYEQVWSLARQIPHGKVATYGQIARMLPVPENVSADDYRTYASRWVGLAMASCPGDVPWQRVVNSQGKVSHPQAGLQVDLLQKEGVLFNRKKLELKEYQWQLSDTLDEPKQGRLF